MINRFEDLEIDDLTGSEQKTLVALAKDVLAESVVRGRELCEQIDIEDYLQLHYAEEKHELFGMIMLDSKSCVLAEKILFRGSLDRAAIHNRVIVSEILDANASAVIFFHNHPSGNPDSSGHDYEITGQLFQLLDLMQIRLVDHIIVARGGIYSFQRVGDIDRWRQEARYGNSTLHARS